MRLTERVLKAYAAEIEKTGSYLITRQAVMARYKLTERRLDALLRAGGRS